MRLRSRVLLQIVLLIAALTTAGLCWLTVVALKSSATAESERAGVAMIQNELRLFQSSISQSEVAGRRYLERLFVLLPLGLENMADRAREAGWRDLLNAVLESRQVMLHWRDSMPASTDAEMQQYLRHQALQAIARTLDVANFIAAGLASTVYANQQRSAWIYASSVTIFVVIIVAMIAMLNYMFVAPLNQMTNRVRQGLSAAPAITGKVVVLEVLDLAAAHDRSRAALADSEQRMRAVFEQSAVGVGLATPGRILIAVNEKFCQMTGYSEYELLALDLKKLSFAADYEKQLELHRRAVAGEIDSYILEKRYIRKDGSLIWVNLAVAMVRNDDGSIRYDVGIVQDITDRVEAEEAAEQQRSLLEATLNSSTEGVIVCDASGNLTIFNRAAEQLHGHGVRQLTSAEWASAYDLYHGDGKTPLAEGEIPLYRALEGETVRNFEFVIAPRGLEPRTVLASAAPVLDGDGNRLGAVVSLQNITERKRAEQALRVSYQSLERRVRERTADLANANARLQELDQLKSLFIASMSHELRTPLNSIIGFAGLMLMRTDGPLNEAQEDYMRRVKASGKHLLSLISDVIDVSKIEAGNIEPDVQHFDLADVIDEAIGLVRLEAEAKGLSIEPPEQYHFDVYSDQKRVLQCLLNYLSNAVKFSSIGRIRIAVKEMGDCIEISVIDQGIGVAERHQADLFQQFSRINTAQSRDLPGTGLGLYLTARLVQRVLGGSVGVDSREGSGSRFWFTMARKLKP